jgi:serine/threonine protein kinase
MGFIDRGQWSAALHASKANTEQSLEQILFEQRALDPDTLRLLQSLVAKHLELHGGDPVRSLQTLSSLGQPRDVLQSPADDEIRATWRNLGQPGGEPAPRPASQAPQIDRLCDRFSEAWRAGQHPRIEEYLRQLPSRSHDPLLEELLKEEIYQRQNIGDSPEPAEYHERFPHHRPLVDRAFAFYQVASRGGATVSLYPKPEVGDVCREQPRFRVIRPHAKGGLGEVFVAHDTELNREVALKEIQAQFASDDESRSRFLREAEVTGRLEHPGIVPVYGLGHHADGRPFYAMRFIQGDSLKEAMEQFHRRRNELPDAPAGEVEVEFRKLLGRFVDVCEAMEYAHSRGVLHRDLKPGNIMLGKYGETLVVDWGLAKVVGGGADHRELGEVPRTAETGSGPFQTNPGSALGTPIYMSPEQAAGRVHELGPATDVYSLGATLYQLLTGQPPFVSDKTEELFRRVQSGDFVRPRDRVANQALSPSPPGLDEGSPCRAIPPALEAICLKAMSLKAADRYPSAAALARDIERYLADEPVSAITEPRADRVRRWIRKHQTAVGSLGAGLLVATVFLGVVSAVVTRNNTALGQANERITGQSRQIQQQVVELQWANAAATRAKEEAESRRQQAEQAAAAAKASELSSVEKSAEVAVRRGDWTGALDLIGRALELTSDPQQRARLSIEKAKAEWILCRTRECRATLAELRRQVASGPLKWRIALWSGFIESDRGTPEAARWLEEAGSEEGAASLLPGERSLIRALLARQSSETVRHLRELLEEDRFFPGGQHLLIFAHVMRGERALAHREIEFTRRLHPRDPNTPLLEALLLACEASPEEFETRLPPLLEEMSESARPLMQTVVPWLAQKVAGLREHSPSESVPQMLFQEIHQFFKILQSVENAGQDNQVLGPAMFLAQRWLGKLQLLDLVKLLANPEPRLSEMLEADPMADLHLVRGMVRLSRGALAEAEADFEAAAREDRLLLPLEAKVAEVLLNTQLQRGLQQEPGGVDQNAHYQRARQNLPRLREAIAQRGPPFAQDLQDYILNVARICRELSWSDQGLEFIQLWEARQAPNSRTLTMQGDLLRAAAVPELFRALDCYQRALAIDPLAEEERRELEERVRETRREIQQKVADFAPAPALQEPGT